MNQKVENYRKRVHRCVYCQHLDRSEPDIQPVTLWWCRAKNRTITLKQAYRRRFMCSCYDVKKPIVKESEADHAE